ncbi:PEP-CTERM sorting domain-containing protein [Sphaerothrix gracilis]|uniref:PEP-CTERM sorting domain-containing protein n=1 Tax=Sphaerothrix gracilis TaxID=3151835 RepID=UPI0031FD1629
MIKLSAILGLVVTVSLGMVSGAEAFTLTPAPDFTDSEFEDLVRSGGFTELFVTESRAGNNGNSGDRELGINGPLVPNSSGGFDPVTPVAEGQRTWNSGQVINFELIFDAVTNLARYTVGSQTLTANFNAFDPNSLYIRTRSEGRNGGTAAFTLQNLQLDDGTGFQALPNVLSSGSDRDVSYLIVSDLNASFTLRGEQILAWSGDYPRGSRLASQIKVGSSPAEPVPEPMTLLGSLAAVGMGLGLKRYQETAREA